MAAPKSTHWALEPHTSAKHAILRRYLDAWIPILNFANYREVLYIDAFAGPGSYSGGEDGSPIIALKALAAHQPALSAIYHFHFVEEKADRAAALQVAVDRQLLSMGNPQNLRVVVHCSSFEAAYPKIKLLFPNQKLPPTFAFIDPFGWTGLPFDIVREILSFQSCEVMINFMFEEINRFLANPDQNSNFDQLFGGLNWRKCAEISDPKARNKCLHDLYGSRLSSAASFVRSFEMRNFKNSTDYYLFFATRSIDGLKKMKASMWKVDEGGAFTFSDATDTRQSVLFEQEPQFDLLRRQIVQKFAGKTVSVDQIERFVISETAFRETHFKVQILKVLEATVPPGLVVTTAKPGRKRGQFPSGTVVRFAP